MMTKAARPGIDTTLFIWPKSYVDRRPDGCIDELDAARVDDVVDQDTCRRPERLRADLSSHDPVPITLVMVEP